MNIEVGMLVMVINVSNHSIHSKEIGRVGTVLRIEMDYLEDRKGSPETGTLIAILEGEKYRNCLGQLMGFDLNNLRPVPPNEPADEDFQEDLKRWLDKKVSA